MLNAPTDNLWRVVSRGYAANNADLDDVWLEVFCPEMTGFVDGEINSIPQTFKTSGVDHRGNHYTCEVMTTNSIKTKWKPSGTNRITPPNVRRGERVEVWQYADADAYYWSTTGEDDHQRRLETVTHAYSNTQDEKTQSIDKSNSYYTTISTHQGKIELGTSKSNGEPYSHLMQIDTKKGLFTYQDDVGNVIQVNSAGNQIFIENASGSKIVIDKGKIDITAPESITMNTKSFNLNASETNIKSNTTVTGNTNLKGKTDIQGTTSITGSMSNNGKNVGSTHTHGGIRGGDGRTLPPS